MRTFATKMGHMLSRYVQELNLFSDSTFAKELVDHENENPTADQLGPLSNMANDLRSSLHKLIPQDQRSMFQM